MSTNRQENRGLNYHLRLAERAKQNFMLTYSEIDLEQAIDCYKRVLELDPEYLEAKDSLIMLLWQDYRIEIDDAIEYYYENISNNPNSVSSHINLGYFLKLQGEDEQAKNMFKKAIKIAPLKSAKARLALSSILRQSKNMKDMVASIFYLVTGTLLLPADMEALKLLFIGLMKDVIISQYLLAGRIHEAVNNYQAAIKLYESAIDKTQIVEEFYLRIGKCYIKLGNDELAANYFRMLINLDPSNKQYYQELLDVLDKEIDLDEIIHIYKSLANLEPQNDEYFFKVAQLEIENSNNFGAILAIQRAIALKPKNPYYRNTLAYVLVLQEDYKAAIREYQTAISLHEENAWTATLYLAMGTLYAQIENNKEAGILAFTNSIRLNPLDIEAYMALGEAYYDIQDFDNALETYNKLLEIDQENSKAYCNKAFLLWEMDQTEQAMDAYRISIELDPDNDIAHNNLGVAYLDGLCNLHEAEKCFDHALAINPNYALAYYNKGRILECRGNKVEAAKYYQTALDINTFTNELNAEELEEKLYQLFSV